MRYVIVGASAGLGRALAERLAADKHDLFLVARDLRDLDSLAADLRLRFNVTTHYLAGNLEAPNELARQLLDKLSRSAPCDGLLFPAGVSSDDDAIDTDPERGRLLLEANFRGVAVVVSALLPLLASGKGVIVGFGSVAAARGRSVNVMYSASKRALGSYFESLRHALVPHGIRVQFYVPGYIDTAQTFSRRTPFPVAAAGAFADRIVRQLPRDFGTAYYPAWWGVVCFFLRLLPWSVMRRLRF